MDTNPLIIVTEWDGVHCFVDRVRPAVPGVDLFDVRFRDPSNGSDQIEYGVGAGTSLRMPAHGVQVDYNAGDSDVWLPLQEARVHPALMMTFDVMGELPESLAPRAQLVGRHKWHTVTWRVVTREGDAVVAAPVNLSPRHVLRAPGDCVVIGPGFRLTSRGPAEFSYQLIGPANRVTPTARPLDGPITVAVARPRPDRDLAPDS